MIAPTWQPRQADEHLHAYGSRILQYLLAHSVTLHLTDEDLELADHIAIMAVAPHDINPIALENISTTRTLIAQVLRIRARLTREDSNVAVRESASQDSKPNIGPMAPLSPVPIVRPPSAQAVKPDFAF